MSKAAGLREARENAYWPDFVPGNAALSRAILDAIDIALPILEADPELVERIMAVLPRDPYNKDQDRSKRILAEKILTALTTPTPGGQES